MLACAESIFHYPGAESFFRLEYRQAVTAFELAAEKDGIQGRTYLIADENYFSLNDLVRHVATALNKEVKIRHLPFKPLRYAAITTEIVCKPLRISPPIFRRRVDWFKQNRAFKIEKAKNELGYRPRVGIEEGLSKTADWYYEKGYLSRN